MAATFSVAGNSYALAITVGGAIKVRDELGVDLSRLGADELKSFAELIDDRILVARVVAVLCAEQLERNNVTPAKFFDLIEGEKLDEVHAAFIPAVCDFFPSGQRQAMRALVAKLQQAAQVAASEALQRIEQTDARSIFSGSPGKSAESSASTLAPSASGSSAGCSTVDAAIVGNTAPG